MRSYKALATLFTFVIVGLLFVGYYVKPVSAGCKCISQGTVDQHAGVWVAYDDGSGLPIPGGGGNQLGGCDGAKWIPPVPPGAGGGGGSHGLPGACGELVYPGCGFCDPLTQAKISMWFRVPTLGDLVGNIIRLMFFIAGLYALVLLLLGGFEWVSSGGDDKKLTSARGKIFNAIIGLVVMVAVLTLVIILEQVVFGGKVCLGISCPINMGDLRIIK